MLKINILVFRIFELKIEKDQMATLCCMEAGADGRGTLTLILCELLFPMKTAFPSLQGIQVVHDGAL